MILPDKTKDLLQEYFLTMQRMLTAGFSRRGVQKSFEEMMYSIMGKDSWRPTHISESAITEYVIGSQRNIQRAHGVLPDRIDRIDRTMLILEGDFKTFDEWWNFFTYHDRTILITRKEHAANIKFEKSDLVRLPDWNEDMFRGGGFTVNLRKKTEGVWIRNKYSELKGVNITSLR
jgi:hypothetical protein